MSLPAQNQPDEVMNHWNACNHHHRRFHLQSVPGVQIEGRRRNGDEWRQITDWQPHCGTSYDAMAEISGVSITSHVTRLTSYSSMILLLLCPYTTYPIELKIYYQFNELKCLNWTPKINSKNVH